MTKEEMIEQLISLKENAKSNIDTDEIFRKDYEALEIALKLIDEQETEIKLNNKVIDKRNEEKLELAKMLLKKDKIVDLMAEMLVKVPNNSDSPQTAAIIAMINRDLELKKIKVKQYFEKKVENDN